MSERFIFYCSNDFNFNLFVTVADLMEVASPIFVTHRYSVHRKIIGRGFVCLRVKANFCQRLQKFFSLGAQLKEFYNAQEHVLEELFYDSCNTTLCVWNGENVKTNHLVCVAKQNNVRVAFFELANIRRDSVQVDLEGVNAGSSISRDESLEARRQTFLDHPVDGYIETKDQVVKRLSAVSRRQIPQNLRRQRFALEIDDLLDYFFGGFSLIGASRSYLCQVIQIFIKAIDLGSLPEDYSYFPLQVSNDTQVVKHSDVDILDLILQLIKRKDVIVLRLHPAEASVGFMFAILWLWVRRKVIVSGLPNDVLAKSANKVITINSTVGFENIFLKGEGAVEMFGRTIYKNNIDHCMLLYNFGFVGIDPFTGEFFPNTKERLRAIFERE